MLAIEKCYLAHADQDVAKLAHKGLVYSEERLIRILKKSYIEARYPVPRSQMIYKEFPFSGKPGFYSDPIGETAPLTYARETALQVLRRLECDFDVRILCGEDDKWARIDPDNWKKFRRLFFKLEVPA